MKFLYIDSHAHLDGAAYAEDRDAVLERARAAGVGAIVSIGNGEGPETADCGIRLSERYEGMYATVGVHPHEARLATDADFERLAGWAKHAKVIAWGEIGLDYFYDHSPREVQKKVFARQMELARAARLPIVIHCRPSEGSEDAWNDCLGMIEEQWRGSGLGGVLHCFTGTAEQARRALDIDFMISFAGNVTFPKAQQIRDAAMVVPLERMLIETDSPYLAPVPHRGKRNEPAFVVETARRVGELRGLRAEEVGERTSRNFVEFFKIAEARG